MWYEHAWNQLGGLSHCVLRLKIYAILHNVSLYVLTCTIIHSASYRIVGDLMPLRWESDSKYNIIVVESVTLDDGRVELVVGNPRDPHPLYETICAEYLL